MSSTYTQQYTKPYTDGYKDRPDESTPEYARFINARDDTLIRIEAFLAALNIPSKLSELVNDEGFIKNTVSNLANYYLKSETYARTETYTREEVQALIADAVSKVSGKLNISVVDALPTSDISTTTFYLVPKETAQEKNLYDEYINTDGTSDGWELIGAVSTSVDLSEYYKKTEVDTLLANKVSTSDLVPSKFSGTKAIIGNQVSSGGGGSAMHVYSTEEQVVGTFIDGKPIYEKTIEFTCPGYGFSNVIYEFADFDKCIGLSGFCQSDSYSYLNIASLACYLEGGENVYEYFSLVIKNKSLYLTVSKGLNVLAGKPCYCTIQYTKTTDTVTT